MKLKQILNEVIIESKSMIVYHGSPNKFDNFDLSRVGKGNDQNGPGVYFTINREEAETYGQYVNGYELNVKKWLSTKKSPNIIEIQKLVTKSPEYDENIYDWAENPQKGLRTYLSNMKDEDSNFHAFVSVWYDFYKNNPDKWVENVAKMGYDAALIKGSDGYGDIGNTTHIIVYNSNAIKKVQ